MNKDFIENCKLLKSHFAKLAQANTNTGESKFNYEDNSETSSAAATINRAEQLLFLDRIDLLENIDIEDIKQHALLKYTDGISDHFHPKNHRLCQRNQFTWNNEIFCKSCTPYNTDKIIVFNQDNEDEYVTKEKEVLEHYDTLVENSKIEANKEIDGTEVIVKNICPEKNIQSESTENTLDIKEENGVASKIKSAGLPESKKINSIEASKVLELEGSPPELTVVLKDTKKVEFASEVLLFPKNIEEIESIPELKIIPQENIDITSILEVKQININEDEKDEKNENISVVNECLDVTPKPNKLKRNSHSSKINSFLENVEHFQKSEKSKSFVSLAEVKKTTSTPTPQKQNKFAFDKISSYAHRFKAQKNIIEMQKERLMEQNKIIAQLTLSKIQNQVQESLENAQKEFKKISPIQKNKLKFAVVGETDENAELNGTLKLTKAPKIVQHMAERAREREERRMLINERKRMLEEEKQRLIEQSIQRKFEEEQTEKQKRLSKLKEQRDQVRQAELFKQEMKKKYIEINEMAIKHYKDTLKKHSLNTFKMCLYKIQIKIDISKRFYENNIVIKFYKLWKLNATKLIEYKSFVASRSYKKYALTRAMRAWKLHHLAEVQKNQVAIDRFEMSLQYNSFKAWLELKRRYHKEFKKNAIIADLHYTRILIYQCFHSWRSLPAILSIERVQSERKKRWRLRVAQILADYDPLKTE